MDPVISQLQQRILEIIPALDHQVNIQDLSEIIVDKALALRFLTKYRFKVEDAFVGLEYHLKWRIENRIYDYSPFNTSHYWLEAGLFQMGNLESRPIFYIFPAKYDPNIPNAKEMLTSSLILCLETMRRWICYREIPELKVVAVLDLHKFGLTQMVL